MSSVRRFIAGFLAAMGMVGAVSAQPAATQPISPSTGRWNAPMGSDQHADAGYLAFTPPGWDQHTPLPLLIFLHGAGYRGDDLAKLDRSEIVRQIRGGRVFDAIVLCPQVPTYWSGEQAAAFIDHAIEAYAGRFDPDRVYLTGESAGGGGTWEGAKRRADRLAAAVPIATTLGQTDHADQLVNLPIWAFHNVHDPYQSVEKSRAQVNAIRQAGGTVVFLTEYTDTPGKMHDGIYPNAHRHAWETAYRDRQLWEWLFRQRRGHPERARTPPPTTQSASGL